MIKTMAAIAANIACDKGISVEVIAAEVENDMPIPEPMRTLVAYLLANETPSSY